jgi:undecaprenyl-diphosphatase
MSSLLDFDLALFTLINQTLSFRWLDPLMILLTLIGEKKWLIAIPALYYVLRGGRRERIIILMALLAVISVDYNFSHGLKPHFDRLRPYLTLDHVRLLVPTIHLSEHSFPSNHAGNTFSVATFFALIYRRLNIILPFLAVAFLVAYSRVFIGVHYPADVLAGACFGAVIGGAWYGVWRQLPEEVRCPKKSSS